MPKKILEEGVSNCQLVWFVKVMEPSALLPMLAAEVVSERLSMSNEPLESSPTFNELTCSHPGS